MAVATRTKAVAAGNRSYRKHVAKCFREGHGKLRVYGGKGNWFLGVELPHKVVPVSNLVKGFFTKAAAVLHGLNKFGVKATQVKLETAKAA